MRFADASRTAAIAGTAMSTPAFPAAVRGDAGRRGGQYGDAVGDAGDRPRDRHRRFLGRGRLHLSAVLWVLMAPYLGARRATTTAASALMLLGLGGFIVSMTALRAGARRRPARAGRRRRDLRPVRVCSAPSTARSAPPRRAPTQAYLASRTRRVGARQRPVGAGLLASASAPSSARRSRRCSCSRRSACPARCSPSR